MGAGLSILAGLILYSIVWFIATNENAYVFLLIIGILFIFAFFGNVVLFGLETINGDYFYGIMQFVMEKEDLVKYMWGSNYEQLFSHN